MYILHFYDHTNPNCRHLGDHLKCQNYLFECLFNSCRRFNREKARNRNRFWLLIELERHAWPAFIVAAIIVCHLPPGARTPLWNQVNRWKVAHTGCVLLSTSYTILFNPCKIVSFPMIYDPYYEPFVLSI